MKSSNLQSIKNHSELNLAIWHLIEQAMTSLQGVEGF